MIFVQKVKKVCAKNNGKNMRKSIYYTCSSFLIFFLSGRRRISSAPPLTKERIRKMENLKIEYIETEKLKAYDKNTRKHADLDVRNIAKSIEKYGFNDPIGVYGKDNTIVEGHGRLLAAKKLGMDKVPVVRLDHMTDKQRREYAIAHNATAMLSEWDFDFLNDELSELDLTDFDFDFLDEGETVGNDEHLREQNEIDFDKVKEGAECECPSCGFRFFV